MKKLIAKIRKSFPYSSIKQIEAAFIATYGLQHHLELHNSVIIKRFLGGCSYKEIADFISENMIIQGVDELVIAFEILIENEKKKSKGMVYTPPIIRSYILEEVIKGDIPPVVIDPACGCGAFLISAAQVLHQNYNLTYHEICSQNLWGCDIDAHSIEKCKMLLEILMLQSGESSQGCKYNLLIGNSLEKLAQKKYLKKFDIVVGNPPYVRAKNIDEDVKQSLSNWSVVSGNVDLYIPFYQLGLELLNEHGKLGYISPNTYLQSINGRGLRNLIRNSKNNTRIINFKESQKFADVTHYTCITFIDKDARQGIVEYSIFEQSFTDCIYTSYDISGYPDNYEWRFGNRVVDQMIYKIEHQPDKLDNYNIRNGLATLCNELFFFEITEETKYYYVREYNGKKYTIEKDICVDIVKPNIMRSEEDLIEKGEKAIYPYKNGKIIPEISLKSDYPRAYKFLSEYKDKLMSRDKGKIDNYPAWYAYGRTQGMNNYGSKVFIPYMADRGVAIISYDPNLLFYCGYAAFSNDANVLKLLKLFIESDVFWFYIKMTSKPYSKGYMALAKNYIKNFGLPHLNKSKINWLFKMNSDARERYIANLYNLDYEVICSYIKAC